MKRRLFLGGILGALASPAIVRATSLMPVRVPPLVVAQAIPEALPSGPVLEITGFDALGLAVRVLDPMGRGAFGLGDQDVIGSIARIVSGIQTRWINSAWPENPKGALTPLQLKALAVQKQQQDAWERMNAGDGWDKVDIEIPVQQNEYGNALPLTGFVRVRQGYTDERRYETGKRVFDYDKLTRS